jgi:DNA-binding GntR family transcriptional regulator
MKAELTRVTRLYTMYVSPFVDRRRSTVDIENTPRTRTLLDAKFKVLTPPSLTESVANELRDGISSGRLKPGERLVEADLAAQMGISRAPVREALRQLEFEGLVEGRPRRGYVVRQMSAAELSELYDLRVLLEPVLARSAAERVTPDDLADLRRIVDRMHDAARNQRWADVAQADREFHIQVGHLSDRPLTAQIFDHLHEQVRRFTELMTTSYTDIAQMADEHETLLAALASGDPDRAGEEMRLHLDDARRRLTLILDEGEAMPSDPAGVDGHGVGGGHVSATTNGPQRRERAARTAS